MFLEYQKKLNIVNKDKTLLKPLSKKEIKYF